MRHQRTVKHQRTGETSEDHGISTIFKATQNGQCFLLFPGAFARQNSPNHSCNKEKKQHRFGYMKISRSVRWYSQKGVG
ncbi:predicted protein [Methanosarcina acetivorans C2A]|uniref:Uncharacterized protein n=1 Tax=Methanosarcina acetivorans (strain ATCC 35395 / DSM 2834 / JCM 12185 / C2A) TaxID=188937 RepID=Q8TSJ5_METAC|nr:predicted protein [Methanosarcina acetivorans C2A]